ncbi:MAG: heme o synthase [Chloroflexota bacterium]
MNNLKTNSIPDLLPFRRLALATTIVLFLVIVTGSILRTVSPGNSCPDWPTCFNTWMPPDNQGPLIDYAHRAATVLAVILALGFAVLALIRHRQQPLLFWFAQVAMFLMSVQVALGAALALNLLSSSQAWLSTLHLGFSLLALAASLTATLAAFGVAIPHNLAWSGFTRLSLLTTLAVFLLLVSGAIVAGSQASSTCQAWPLCDTFPSNSAAWINLSHRGLVALAGILLFTLLVQAWRTQRTQTPVITATTAAAVLFLAQALLGARMVQGFPGYLLVLHTATAVAVWAVLVVQFITVLHANRASEQESLEAASLRGRKGLLKDLLLLTKPIVVLLLLVTTYAGMVIGAREWPAFPVAFWTLVGGFMAAGGSGAINQYIDRYDDQKMQRTQKRPIPAGRLTPGEGLAFGVAMTLASFYLVTAYVNLLAALLTLAGIIYYVLIYSIFLKKTTVQNIVIGGGAGAIPPLVGWAAATGSLNIPSLFLFAVVFMWTPPHFWALALVRRKDYARAGVPMLPVVRGEAETRWQIFIYTLELVALTLVLPIFGLGGGIYLVGAGMLGLWLLSTAYRVWKQGGNKLAWKMYRYSSMYLAFIFLVLMIDRLV